MYGEEAAAGWNQDIRGGKVEVGKDSEMTWSKKK